MFKKKSNDNVEVTITADSVSHIAKTVSDVSREISNYLSVREDNVTERKRIAAALETATNMIESDLEKFRIYMDKMYKEKDYLYSQGERLLDKGIHENSLEIINAGCNFMMAVFNKNPMEGYKSQIDFTSTVSGFFQTDFSKKIGE